MTFLDNSKRNGADSELLEIMSLDAISTDDCKSRGNSPYDEILANLGAELDQERQLTESFNASTTTAAEHVTLTENSDEVITQRCLRMARLLEETATRLRTEVGCLADRPRARRKPKIPRLFTDHLFLITLIWQVLCVIILSIADYFDKDPIKDQNTPYIVGMFIMITFQVSNLFLAVATTVKLTKQYMHHTVTTTFLLQSYFATIVLFSGIYAMIFRLNKHSFNDVEMSRNEKAIAAVVFVKMVFYSISTGTLCGTASIGATVWYSQLFAAFQMLLSFVYFASILSQAVSPASRSRSTRRRGSLFGISADMATSTGFTSTG